METLLTIVHSLVALFLILVVLLQSGRGGGMGIALGGASSQIFGGRGASTFLTKLTSIAAVTFFLTSFTLTVMSSRQHSVVAAAKAQQSAEEPAKIDPAKPEEVAPAVAPESEQAPAAPAPAAPAAGSADTNVAPAQK